jgi:hypothetical protein
VADDRVACTVEAGRVGEGGRVVEEAQQGVEMEVDPQGSVIVRGAGDDEEAQHVDRPDDALQAGRDLVDIAGGLQVPHTQADLLLVAVLPQTADQTAQLLAPGRTVPECAS